MPLEAAQALHLGRSAGNMVRPDGFEPPTP